MSKRTDLRFYRHKKKETFSVPMPGGSFLLVIFAVLCLSVFAVLSLSTVLADKRICDASVQAVEAYYEADHQAEIIFAQLRGGSIPEGVQVDGQVYSYVCPVSAHQQLEVVLYKQENTWRIERWQAVTRVEYSEEAMPVWDGELF